VTYGISEVTFVGHLHVLLFSGVIFSILLCF
jgi:hypothetical protein